MLRGFAVEFDGQGASRVQEKGEVREWWRGLNRRRDLWERLGYQGGARIGGLRGEPCREGALARGRRRA
jgi:hypothetical protein